MIPVPTYFLSVSGTKCSPQIFEKKLGLKINAIFERG
jgi:hypothetical protein